MRAKLLGLLPSMRWIPHDIPQPDSGKKKDRAKPHRSLLSRKPSEPDHGTPRRRKSTLSFTSIPDEELDARTHMQAQSMFFAMLPIEIRKMVYEYVMAAETVHLTLGAKRKFGHFICPLSERDEERDAAEQGDCGCKVLVGGAGHNGRLSCACLRVLRVCRRMYCESAPHLYTPHVFSLLHITHLLYLPSRVPQQRLNTIRTLRLRWTIRALPYYRRGPSKHYAYIEDTANWEKAWDILAGMRALQDLRVVLVDPSRDGIWEGHWLELEHLLLEPPKKVTGPRWFEIMLPYATCGLDWDMGESNARLTKPPGDEETEDEDD